MSDPQSVLVYAAATRNLPLIISALRGGAHNIGDALSMMALSTEDFSLLDLQYRVLLEEVYRRELEPRVLVPALLIQLTRSNMRLSESGLFTLVGETGNPKFRELLMESLAVGIVELGSVAIFSALIRNNPELEVRGGLVVRAMELGVWDLARYLVRLRPRVFRGGDLGRALGRAAEKGEEEIFGILLAGMSPSELQNPTPELVRALGRAEVRFVISYFTTSRILERPESEHGLYLPALRGAVKAGNLPTFKYMYANLNLSAREVVEEIRELEVGVEFWEVVISGAGQAQELEEVVVSEGARKALDEARSRVLGNAD